MIDAGPVVARIVVLSLRPALRRAIGMIGIRPESLSDAALAFEALLPELDKISNPELRAMMYLGAARGDRQPLTTGRAATVDSGVEFCQASAWLTTSHRWPPWPFRRSWRSACRYPARAGSNALSRTWCEESR